MGSMNALSVQWQGFFFLLLLLMACAVLVHLVRLALLGYRALMRRARPQPPAQDPVYFLVERKKKRAKAEYGAPKKITFK